MNPIDSGELTLQLAKESAPRGLTRVRWPLYAEYTIGRIPAIRKLKNTSGL